HGDDTHRAPWSVHQRKVRGKVILDAMFVNGMGVPTTHFHELVVAPWISQMGNLPGQHTGHLGVSEFVNKTHALSLPPASAMSRCATWLLDARVLKRLEFISVRLPECRQERQRRLGLLLIDLRQSKADVDEDPVPRLDRLVREHHDVDTTSYPTDLDQGEMRTLWKHFHDLSWNRQAHAL